jgi:nucleoside-diphosphate-sugar epimerase
MREPMAGVDGVFHLAAWFKVGARDRSMAHAINVDGTRNVLELMKELAIPKGVYTSTLGVFSNTHGRMVDESHPHAQDLVNEYERTKLAALDEVVRPMVADGLPLVTVLPGVSYGPGDQGPLRQALVLWLKGRLPVAPEGAAFCWAHVDDTARGHLLAMDKGRPGEEYIIAGPPHGFLEVFELAAPIAGRRPPPIKLPPGLLRRAAGIVEHIEQVIPVPETFAAESLRSTAGVTHLGSSARAERELGFSARPLADGLPEAVIHEMQLLGLASPNP